jgi:hypothetical protein
MVKEKVYGPSPEGRGEERVLSGCLGRDRTYDQVNNSHLLYR